MSDTDFLKKVQPSGGYIVIVGINPDDKDDVQTRYAETDKQAEAFIGVFKRRKFHTYYGVAKYATVNSRKADNVKSLKAIWLDVDCNKVAPKGYETKAEGQIALDAFVSKYNLPTPATVDSGNGIHAYWLLTDEVGPTEWRAVSDALKAACQAEGFFIDPSVMEEARIMRVPGTTNYKDGETKPVTLLSDVTTPISLGDFADKIGGVVIPTAPKSIFGKGPSRGATPLGKALAADTYAPSDFAKVKDKCAQIAHCVDNRATLSEPLWRAALSVAIRTTAPEPAVDEVSRDYPDYDLADAMAKADLTKGPFSCSQFESLNPGGCDACPFRIVDDQGKPHYKQTSPIALGELLSFLPKPVARTQPLPDAIDMPSFPPGYYRDDTNGGIWKMSGHPDKADEEIYSEDFYIAQRLYSASSSKEAFILRLHFPHDAVREFTVSGEARADTKEFKKILCGKGMCFDSDAHFGRVKKYVEAFVKYLQSDDMATPMYEQFGWAEEDREFVLGDQKITPTGSIYSPPSPMTRPFADMIHRKGTLCEWKRVIAVLGQPGMEAHAFAFLTAFGAPLFKFLGHNGAAINLYSPDSGTGKTTVLKLINSVYGHPKLLMSTPDDTYNARVAKLGIYNNIPFTADEMTNTPAEDISRLLYSMSQGRGKDRMAQSNNHLRENNTTWQTISVCNANNSFASKLQAMKNNPDGELMRLLEFPVFKQQGVTVANKRLMDEVLTENYGWAGPMYIDYVIRNRDRAIHVVRAAQGELIAKLAAEQHERFWVATVASNLTGGLIAQDRLGLLIGWKLNDIRDWAIENFYTMRKGRVMAMNTAENVLGGFLLKYYSSITPVKSTAPGTQGLLNNTGAKVEPLVRLEDNKFMYIYKKRFQEYCIETSADEGTTLLELKRLKILLDDTGTMRLAPGTTPVRCLKLDYTHPAFSGLPTPPNATGT